MLNPNQAGSEDLVEHISKKYGPRMAQMMNSPQNPLTTAGRAVGINFNNARRVIQTVDCHRVMELSKTLTDGDTELCDQLMEVLYRRYFVEAKDVSNKSELLDSIAEVGLGAHRQRFSDMLDSDELKSEVVAKDTNFKSSIRVSGVPFFIIQYAGDKSRKPITFSGAQPSEIIKEQLLEALEG